MSEQTLNTVKPGNNRSRIRNQNFKKNQIKTYRKNRDSHFYWISTYDYALLKYNKIPQEAIEQNLCKIGKHGQVTGFNFKKCNATKFIYGSDMYKYTYAGKYSKKHVTIQEERNVQNKCRQKLRNQICLKWE